MFHPARLACCAALIVLVAFVAFAVRPAVLADLGLDLSDWPDQLRDLDRAIERREKLLQKFSDLKAAIQAKDRVSRELIAGRMTLGQAARRFCELADRPEPEYLDLLGRYYPGDTGEESLCRHVIEWACKSLENEPSRQEVVCRRLEDELREHLRELRDGR